MRISKNAVFYNTMMLTFSNIALQILGFIYRIFLSRVTGAEGMGVYQLVMPYYSVLQALTLYGLSMSMSRISAEPQIQQNRARIQTLMNFGIYLFLALLTFAALPTILFSKWISQYLLGDLRTQISLVLLIPCLFLTGFENLRKSYFFGTKNVRPPIISENLEMIIRISAVASLFFIVRPNSPAIASALIIGGMIVSEIFSATILTIFYKKSPGGQPTEQKVSFRFKKDLLSKIAAIAIPVSSSGLLTNLLFSVNAVLIPRQLIASGMDSFEAIGIFGVLFGMTMPLLMFPTSFIGSLTTILVPKLSEGIAIQNTADVRRKAAKALHVTGILAFPSLSMIIPLGSTLCKLLFKQNVSIEFIIPLAIGSLFGYYQMTTGSILNGVGLQKRAAAYIITGSIIQLAFTWFLAGNPHFGIFGFIAGFVVSTVINALLNITSIVNKLKIKIQWKNWIIIPAMCGALTGLCSRLIFVKLVDFGMHEALGVICSIFFGISLYSITMYFMGFSVVRYLKTLIPSNLINRNSN